MWFGSDIIVIYYSCNSWVVNLQQILQQQWTVWLWRHWCHSQQRQQVNNVFTPQIRFPRSDIARLTNLFIIIIIYYYIFILKSTCSSRVLKCSLSAHLMRVKLLLFPIYLNGELHAVSIEKPSEWMSNLWTVPNRNQNSVFHTSSVSYLHLQPPCLAC